jgi:hypothetical protein
LSILTIAAAIGCEDNAFMDTSISLTPEQKSALEQGQPIHVFVQDTKTDCVLIRSDVYDLVRSMVYNDGPLSEEENLAAIRYAGQRAGWDDPDLDVYEEYRKKA